MMARREERDTKKAQKTANARKALKARWGRQKGESDEPLVDGWTAFQHGNGDTMRKKLRSPGGTRQKSERDSKRSTASTNHLSIAETQSELPNDFADVHTHRVAWSLSPIIVGSLITVGGRLGLVDYRRKEVLHLNRADLKLTCLTHGDDGAVQRTRTFFV
jgi:hypothetical protein